ncbi:MAG: hypothetical protein J6U98_06970, partial [Abditibacteriota bacterium]|nr:hypothetical protein [Abditibacteriota bacterium]
FDDTKTEIVSGKVTDSATGKPVVGAVVDIGGLTVTTDDDGNYSAEVPAGKTTAAAKLRNMTSEPGRGDLVLKASVFEGVVRDSLGNPRAEAVVSDADSGFYAVTDEEGRYRILLPAGTYDFTAFLYGAPRVHKRVSLGENSVLRKDFVIDKSPAYWNAVKDFHWIDRDNRWQYGYIGANGKFTYITVSEHKGIPGIGGWGNNRTSFIALNGTGDVWHDEYSYLEPGQFAMHSGVDTGYPAALRWTAPLTGTYVIYGGFTGQTKAPYTDSDAKIVLNGKTILNEQLTGFAGTDEKNFTDSEGLAPTVSFGIIGDIKAEETLDFITAPRNGRKLYQLAALDANVAEAYEITGDNHNLPVGAHVIVSGGNIGKVTFTKPVPAGKVRYAGKVTEKGVELLFAE